MINYILIFMILTMVSVIYFQNQIENYIMQTKYIELLQDQE